MIDEHCDIAARQVYDQDNKAWKAISNALKGRVVADDDQYSLGVCLLSRRSSEAECHIYVLPVQDAGDFFFLRSDQYPFPVDLRLHRTARRAYNIGYSGGQIPALARYIQHTILDRTIGASHSRM